LTLSSHASAGKPSYRCSSSSATRAAVSKCVAVFEASETAIDGIPSRNPSVAAATVPE
jgi:hypothetical protein